MTASTPDEAAALLQAMAEHGIRVSDRRFEQAVTAVLAEREATRPVLDAAEEYVDIGGKWSHNELVRAVDAYRAALGSAEACGPAAEFVTSQVRGSASLAGPAAEPAAALPPHPRIWWDGHDFLTLVPGPLLVAPDDDGEVRSTMPGLYRARKVEDVTMSDGSVVELAAMAGAPEPAPEPDWEDDGRVGWLVGKGHDVERDATGSGAATIRIGDDYVTTDRARQLRDALSAALGAGAPQPPAVPT
ncbi:hypothetical protein Psed_5765 [Pseudonocardia dioxanivorans CB1190]|uniref:Uncharacterized protein n=1 Tax=Pseudonocardia dioxanivorans (strain ATCC 55486 / DSM 44775 / JCM 13855 / CB1190) TaxID=675635 RepID=F4D1A4_PSEUX|nr:hypothetical protein [Pseudonocardia dioxanivorans]AEA27892.1 hypothetical protein Psed_5765 [Pseudonocardia dioxanivorans CB1190]